jgi:cellulose biosynthesis protein BcsQ
VFVSHAHADRVFVEGTIKPLLQQHGIKAWWSQENLRGGEEFEKRLRQAVRDSDWFLLVMSPQSQDSAWVKKELRWSFLDKKDRIIPLLYQKCHPHKFDARIPLLHFVDFTQNVQTAGNKLLADMIHKLHEQTCELVVKVEDNSKQIQQLKDSLVEVDRKQREQTAKVQSALGFDGTFAHLPLNNIPPFRRLEERKAPIIAVLNLKGGVGKTTLTANLGAALWSQQPARRVLLVDLDYQANLSLSCLGTDALSRLGDQNPARRGQDPVRLVQELFRQDSCDSMQVFHCIEPILDDQKRLTPGAILACDSSLAVAETHALMKWLLGEWKTDLRFVLRKALHSDQIQSRYDFILLDCPPRLTTACINALTACDYVLIPVILDTKSTEGPPQLLKWLWDRERRKSLDLHVAGAGLLANKTRGAGFDTLPERAKEVWEEVNTQCKGDWALKGFDTVVPLFNEVAMERKFPACFAVMRDIFAAIVGELKAQLSIPRGGVS